MRFRILSIVIFVFSLNCRAQHQVALSLGMNRFDLQLGAGYAYNIKQFQVHGKFDIGINRTFFQQRFFPKISVGGSYDVFKNEVYFLGPQINLSFYTLNYNLDVGKPTFWLDALPGIQFAYGTKWKAILNGFIGPAWQWDHSLNEDKYIKTFFVNFEGSIGCAYTF